MNKYEITVVFKSGQISVHHANELHFHPGSGGIDIFENNHIIPIFPGREEEVKEIRIILPDNLS